MAKSRRKPSAAQRDKYAISVAKKLKEAGILSKQTKLHSGRYISKEVLRKVRELEPMSRLDYKAVKVSKATAQAAKERGYQVVGGNKIIGPSTPQFRNRLKKGELTGVKPVKGGYMEEVILPHTVFDMRSLVTQLEEGIDTLKMPEERFAFKYHGHESWRSFRDTQELLDYLRHYKGVLGLSESMKPEDLQEEFDALTLFRLHPATEYLSIPGPKQRLERAKRERMEAIARGEYVPRPRKRKSKYERADYMSGIGKIKYLERLAKQERKKREKIMADPTKYEAYKAAAKKRAKASRDNKKAQKGK